MELRRRFPAVIALVAVMWATLWPLVSSVQARIAGDDMPLCHQAGMQVEPGEIPQRPDVPGNGGKVHCPLCIMAFFVAFAAQPLQPEFHLVGKAVTLAAYFAPLRHDVSPHLPESRAPPVSLKA